MKNADSEGMTPRGGRRPGAGRPKKYGRAALKHFIHLCATNDQGETWAKAARHDGKDIQDWIRQALNEQAARTLGKEKPTTS